MNSIESRLKSLLEEFSAYDIIIRSKDGMQRELITKIKSGNFGEDGPEEDIKNFTKTNMELTELSMTIDKNLECIKEVYNLAKIGNPELIVDEKYSDVIQAATKTNMSNFGVVNGKVVIVNPDYEKLLDEHLKNHLTKEKVTEILNSPLFKAS